MKMLPKQPNIERETNMLEAFYETIDEMEAGYSVGMGDDDNV